MSLFEKPAAPRGKPGGAVLAFKVAWYGSNVAVGLFCLALFYYLFGLERFVYFLAGIIVVGLLYVAYSLFARRLGRPRDRR